MINNRKMFCYPAPLRLLITISLSVFLTELIIMFFIKKMSLSDHLEIILDGTILTLLLCPNLYFFLYRPMVRYINNYESSQKEIQKLFCAVEQSPTSIVITDVEGNIEYVNPKFSQLTGYSLEELKGNNPRLLKSGEISDYEYNELWETISSGKEWRGEFHNKKKNGELYWEYASISPVSTSPGLITHFVGVKEDITDRKQAEEKINYLAFHDNLTGLPNRLLFSESLKLLLDQAKRNQQMFAVTFLDLDGFKLINDTLGHNAGDLLLKETAKRIKECVRESDVVVRLGGDEFTLLLSNITKNEDAVRVAEKLLDIIQKPWIFENEEYRVTASIGIAIFPRDGKNEQELIRHADNAMYFAKKQGKNDFKIFDETI